MNLELPNFLAENLLNINKSKLEFKWLVLNKNFKFINIYWNKNYKNY